MTSRPAIERSAPARSGKARLAALALALGLFALTGACAVAEQVQSPPASPSPSRAPATIAGKPFPTATPGPSTSLTASPARTPSRTPSPGPTDTPSPSPTARPRSGPTLGAYSTPVETQVTEIPSPMPRLELDASIVNILLLGSDQRDGDSGYRTDTLIVASINKQAGSVTLLSIPRDLFVYIPGWRMQRINTADSHGAGADFPGGGPALLQQTILYNLGIPIHYYARIRFEGFKKVVDTLGGIEVPVACDLTDWRLISPDLDPTLEENYELYTLPAGVQTMDGDLALWYARSRRNTSDFDRARRQQQVLRAIFDKGMRLDILPQIPRLYQQFRELIATNMGLGEIGQFIPLAREIYGDGVRVKSRFIGANETLAWTTPNNGASVRLPNGPQIERLLLEAFQPPASNRLRRAAPRVEIWNGTTNEQLTALAADRLEWDGFAPLIGEADRRDYANTTIIDFTTSDKNSRIPDLKKIYRIADARILAQPDPDAEVDYRVILGADYNPCTFYYPPATPTPTPSQSPEPIEGAAAPTAGTPAPPASPTP